MAEIQDPQDEHSAVEADFSDLFEGALPSVREAEVRAHLAGCDRCRAEYERFRGALSALSGLGRIAAPRRLGDDVAATIHRRSAGRFFGQRAFGDRVPFELLAVIGLALMVAVWLLLRSSVTGTVHEPLREAPSAMHPGDVKDVLPVPEVSP